MAQLIYASAKGVKFLFYAPENQSDFANGIQQLVNEGATIIADDLNVANEPIFQPGEVSLDTV